MSVAGRLKALEDELAAARDGLRLPRIHSTTLELERPAEKTVRQNKEYPVKGETLPPAASAAAPQAEPKPRERSNALKRARGDYA